MDCASDSDGSDSDSASEGEADDNRINRPLNVMTMDPGKLNTISWASFKIKEDFSSEMLAWYVPKQLYETMIPQYHTLNCMSR